MSTRIVTSFVDDTTIQIRLELGETVQGAVTTDIPNNVNFNESDGYGFDAATGELVGRLRGAENQYFVPVDSFTPSDIQDLFTWTETDGIRSAPVDTLADWSVLVDGEAVVVTGISRKANIIETATTGWQRDFTTVHNVFLELAEPLSEGDDIEIKFDDPEFDTVAARYEPDSTVSEAIHVNLTGFDPDDGIKTAYLSNWNGFEYDGALERGGEGKPQDYSEGIRFEVINDATGEVALSGTTVLAQGEAAGTNFWQNYASTSVYQMDLTGLTVEGQYHLVVDGVGRSESFSIDNDHWSDLFGLTFSGYYHQRSGIALTEEFTDFERPRAMHPEDGITVHQTTVKITQTSEAWDGSLPKPFEFWDGNLTGEILDDAWGGWHDAGDFDRRTQHMETSRKLVELHEMHTSWSEDLDGGIPESSDGIPDLLDEAIWGAEVFRRLQHDDGGVPGGIESASYGGFGDSSFTDQRDLYVYAPDVWSSWEYAATAAKIARALEPYDASEAAAWLQSGIDAFDWAEANIPPNSEYENGYYPRSRNIAAAELYETTGLADYNAIFLDTFVYGKGQPVEWFAQQYEAAYAYANSSQAGADDGVQSAAFDALKERADQLLAEGTNSGFGFIADPYAPYGWGNTATQPTNSSEILLRVHALTGDETYLLPAKQDVDYAFGANPMNMSYVTGLDQLVPGVRKAEEILDADTDVLGLDPKPGITLYAEYNIYDYGWGFYHNEMWEDTWPNYYDAPVHESWNGLYSYVPVTEFTVMQGMEDMTFVTGYLAALASDGATPPPPTPPTPPTDATVTVTGTTGSDRIFGTEADERFDLLGGPIDAVRSGGGENIFAFTDQIGVRDSLRIFDFDKESDAIDLGDAAIRSTSVNNGNLTIRIENVDRDYIYLAGVSDIDDVSFVGSEPPTKPEPEPLTILGTAGESDRLTGTALDERIEGLGGPNDALRGGGGSDIFVFADTAGLRDSLRIFDFATSEDILDLSGFDIRSSSVNNGNLTIRIENADRDYVYIANVGDINDLTIIGGEILG